LWIRSTQTRADNGQVDARTAVSLHTFTAFCRDAGNGNGGDEFLWDDAGCSLATALLPGGLNRCRCVWKTALRDEPIIAREKATVKAHRSAHGVKRLLPVCGHVTGQQGGDVDLLGLTPGTLGTDGNVFCRPASGVERAPGHDHPLRDLAAHLQHLG